CARGKEPRARSSYDRKRIAQEIHEELQSVISRLGERRLPACCARQLAGRNLPVRKSLCPAASFDASMFAASCREVQAGSLRSPNHLQPRAPSPAYCFRAEEKEESREDRKRA